MKIIVQQGSLGLYSPKIADSAVVVVSAGIRSRTGKHVGHVDEGYCTDIIGYLPEAEGIRNVVFHERLYVSDRFDGEVINKIGTKGAYVSQKPSESSIKQSVEKAVHEVSTAGTHADYVPLSIKRVVK